MAGMKKATIPTGLRRGQPARAPHAPADEPAHTATAPPPAARRQTTRAKPAATTTTSTSATAALPAPGARPGGNPYAGEKRRPMNHLIFEGISGRLRDLSSGLVEQGYAARSCSQAQLTQAILHFHMPVDAEAAGELIAAWTALTAVPIPSNPYRQQKRRPMNHLVYEGIPVRLGELSEQLISAGYPERSASQAQLTQAILHDGMPADLAEAGELVQRWVLLTAAGPR